MATFTLELWRAIEFAGEEGIGLDAYPIFEESHRAGLNKKITDHYWNREIGAETIDEFRLFMSRRMNEIMPYYNDLFESQRLIIDPLRTIDMRTVTNSESTAESTSEADSVSTGEGKSGSRAVTSQTPQMMLSGNGDYATGATDTNGVNESQANSVEHSSAENAESGLSDTTVTGYTGNVNDLLASYRRTILNLDLMIIDELRDLFMGVWDNGDNYHPYNFTNLPAI